MMKSDNTSVLVGTEKANIGLIIRAIYKAQAAEDIIRIEGRLEALEVQLRKSGISHDLEILRPVNEARCLARWRLGQMLAKE